MTRNGLFRALAAAALLLLGLARGAGGLYLAMQGHAVFPHAPASDAWLRASGALLALISLLAVAAAIALFRRQRAAPKLAATFLILFPLDGALNGLPLYGHLAAGDIVLNCAISVLIAVLLWFGRP